MVPRETSAAVSARYVTSCMHDDDVGLISSLRCRAGILGTKLRVLTTKDYDYCPDFKRLVAV